MTATGHQIDTNQWGSVFGILEWQDVRYEGQRLSSARLLEKWVTQFPRDSDLTEPDVETVRDGTAEALISGLARLISRSGRNIQTLLVLCHGDQFGLCQSVDSEEHLSYNGFWEALSNILEELGSDETEDQINCDIGGGPGHGLVVIFGACYGMAPICNHIQAPKYLGSVVGFTGAPNLSTVETVFSGYALHEKEGFDFVKQVFYDKNKQEGGFDVIAASLNAVTAISDQLEPSAPNPHGRYGDMTPDPDEGKLVEYFPESGRVRRLPLGRTKDAALKQFREETK